MSKYRVRFADGAQDLRAAQELRGRLFRGAGAIDADGFDAACRHVLVEEVSTDRLVCCFRLMPLAGGPEISRSYSAEFYDLTALESYAGSMVEMGRFCVDPDYSDPAILRLAWGAMTAYVDENNVELLFGCSSFSGTDAESYMDAFALLKERHLAPTRWLPRVKAPSVFRYAAKLSLPKPDIGRAMQGMPPLLRSYLAMGGWVSDHAVVDRDLNTLHVFTGLEVKRVPEARARVLRAITG